MNALKKKAMLDTALIFVAAFGGVALVNAIMIYGPMLPFTTQDYGLFAMIGLLVFVTRLTYKMRLEELERRERLSNCINSK